MRAVLRRRDDRLYRQPLIATDLADATSLQPVFDTIDCRARITLLATFRIPRCGPRTMLRAARLERELQVCSYATMLSFVHTSGLDPKRFDLHVRRGDPQEHVLREARTLHSDLVVLAHHRCQRRLERCVLDEISSDLVVVRDDEPDGRADCTPIIVGPWPC